MSIFPPRSVRLPVRLGRYVVAVAIACLLGLPATTGVAKAEDTLAAVKSAGVVKCGLNLYPGFESVDASGQYSGIDVDLCRAIAAAVFGDAGKVKYVVVTAKERFSALQSGVFDVLFGGSAWTFSRSTKLGLQTGGTNFYTGSAFLVRKSLNVTSAKQLNGATICNVQGTTHEGDVAIFNTVNKIKINLVNFDDDRPALNALEANRCDGFINDTGSLAGERLQLKQPDDYIVLPEVISKDVEGPITRQGDEHWTNVVRWSLYAMINAEELGITSANVDQMRATSDNPAIRSFLGVEDNLGEFLGLDKSCFYNIVKQVGNYGESFERNLGMQSPFKVARGVNALWTHGGMQISPPFR